MQNLPHHYTVAADAQPEGHVTTSSPGLTSIEAAPPAEFGGPGNCWSPETFLVAAVADCFVLSFRAVARASRLEWLSLHCSVEGVLDRPEKLTQFTEFHLRVVLDIPADADQNKARRVLDKAEHSCLITNSLSAATHLDAEIRTPV